MIKSICLIPILILLLGVSSVAQDLILRGFYWLGHDHGYNSTPHAMALDSAGDVLVVGYLCETNLVGAKYPPDQWPITEIRYYSFVYDDAAVDVVADDFGHFYVMGSVWSED